MAEEAEAEVVVETGEINFVDYWKKRKGLVGGLAEHGYSVTSTIIALSIGTGFYISIADDRTIHHLKGLRGQMLGFDESIGNGKDVFMCFAEA